MLQEFKKKQILGKAVSAKKDGKGGPTLLGNPANFTNKGNFGRSTFDQSSIAKTDKPASFLKPLNVAPKDWTDPSSKIKTSGANFFESMNNKPGSKTKPQVAPTTPIAAKKTGVVKSAVRKASAPSKIDFNVASSNASSKLTKAQELQSAVDRGETAANNANIKYAMSKGWAPKKK